MRGGDSGHEEDPQGTESLGSSFMRRIWLVPACCFPSRGMLWLSAVLLVPAGFCMMIQMASSNTLIQSMVPDRLRGRVMSVYAMTFMGMAPLGALLAGSLAHKLGAPMTVGIGGVVAIMGAAVFGSKLSCYPACGAGNDCGPADGGRRLPQQEMTGRVFSQEWRRCALFSSVSPRISQAVRMISSITQRSTADHARWLVRCYV